MLEQMKDQANRTVTENGAAAFSSTGSHCLDLFSGIGALRGAPEGDICTRFLRAYGEDRDLAMKLLFFARDVRGGLGERRVFRVILGWLAWHEPEALERNLPRIPEFGRWDDLLVLLDTPCQGAALSLIRQQLQRDLESGEQVSLLAKWLPSVNASNADTVAMAKKIARNLGMTQERYRKSLVSLRRQIRILENNLRQGDYSFDYAQQPAKAMYKYRRAFQRNDGQRYEAYLEDVKNGRATLHTGTLAPYEIIAPCLQTRWRTTQIPESERRAMDVTWNALPDYGGEENALVVVDGSGSMYCGPEVIPATVALSLGIYFAQRNRGPFRDHFITFSRNPKLVQIRGRDIAEKVRYCASFNEVANTDLEKVFSLILDTAVKHRMPQAQLPEKLYIVSDMEFDRCMENGSKTHFQAAREAFAAQGYRLPEVVFWNVASRHGHQPVTRDDRGVALVSGCTPRLFQLVAGGAADPYRMMLEVLSGPRYADIRA